MPQGHGGHVAYQKNVVYAFIKLSAKSHSFNILCTNDGLSCPTNERWLEPTLTIINGSQLAKMKKSIPDMPLPWNL